MTHHVYIFFYFYFFSVQNPESLLVLICICFSCCLNTFYSYEYKHNSKTSVNNISKSCRIKRWEKFFLCTIYVSEAQAWILHHCLSQVYHMWLILAYFKCLSQVVNMWLIQKSFNIFLFNFKQSSVSQPQHSKITFCMCFCYACFFFFHIFLNYFFALYN